MFTTCVLQINVRLVVKLNVNYDHYDNLLGLSNFRGALIRKGRKKMKGLHKTLKKIFRGLNWREDLIRTWVLDGKI